MAYLLVHTGDALGAQSYGMALVWISPHQVWASTMEEAVGTLSACISSGPDWLYALAQLYEGSNHTPLPKDKYIGILPQGKAEVSPYGQISQLSLPAPIPQATSHLSGGLKQGQPVSYHHPARTAT